MNLAIIVQIMPWYQFGTPIPFDQSGFQENEPLRNFGANAFEIVVCIISDDIIIPQREECLYDSP